MRVREGPVWQLDELDRWPDHSRPSLRCRNAFAKDGHFLPGWS
jgi:hypothetical protein